MSVNTYQEFFEPFVVDYDESKYGFVNEVREVLNILHLHHAHRLIDIHLATRETDQKTKLHDAFYDSSRPTFAASYLRFLRDIIAPSLNLLEGMVYQKKPNFRVHMPGSMAVGEFHKDSQYSHSQHEINIWVPLTKTCDSNTIWMESYPDKGDYKPIIVIPGECLVFQGGLLTHGNQVNVTPFTRLSFDFRIIKPEHYVHDATKLSINTSTIMIAGRSENCYFEIFGDHPKLNPYKNL